MFGDGTIDHADPLAPKATTANKIEVAKNTLANRRRASAELVRRSPGLALTAVVRSDCLLGGCTKVAKASMSKQVRNAQKKAPPHFGGGATLASEPATDLFKCDWF